MDYDFWWRLSAIGATIILVYGRIFHRIRPKHYFFHCPMCVGFHVGWFLSVVFFLYYGIKIDFLILFREGCINSLLSYFVGMTLNDEGLNFVVRRKYE